jgi:hypothetical protein
LRDGRGLFDNGGVEMGDNQTLGDQQRKRTEFFEKAPMLTFMVSTHACADVAAISSLPIYFVRTESQ